MILSIFWGEVAALRGIGGIVSSQLNLDDAGSFASLGFGGDDLTAVADRDDVVLCQAVRGSRPDSLSARKAYGELYTRHQGVAMAQAYRLTEDRGRAEDLVSEAFSKTLRALQSGRGPDRSFLGYLLITLRTENLRTVGSPEPMVPTPIDEVVDDALTTPDPVHRISESDQVARAFKDLPESWQRVLWLLEIEELPIEEAAEHLELAPPALRALSYRAREGLRSAYLQQYAETSSESCGEVPSLLAAFTRDNLRPRQQALVTEHLADCADCTAQTSRLSRLNEQLRVWAGPMIIVGGGAAALGSVPDQAQAVAHEAASKAPIMSRVGLLLGVAAVVALSVTGVTLLLSGQESNPIAPPISVEPEEPAPATANEIDESVQVPSPSSPPGPSDPLLVDAPLPAPSDAPATSVVEESAGDLPVEDDTTPNWKLR